MIKNLLKCLALWKEPQNEFVWRKMLISLLSATTRLFEGSSCKKLLNKKSKKEKDKWIKDLEMCAYTLLKYKKNYLDTFVYSCV